MALTDTLAERGKHYEGPGGFAATARTSQTIKTAICTGAGFDSLSDPMKEALSMIANKISRIVNGNPRHPDSWHDIAGYATLVERELTPATLSPNQPKPQCAGDKYPWGVGDRDRLIYGLAASTRGLPFNLIDG